MAISRRSFLKIIGLSALVAASPAFSKTRLPYVTVDSGVVNYIGKNGRGFQGAQIVRKVHEFDGVGYPVDVSLSHDIETYYDFDLSDMNKDVPDNFWWSKQNKEKYPNVHTYIREQRFGESIPEAIDKMLDGRTLPTNWKKYIA